MITQKLRRILTLQSNCPWSSFEQSSERQITLTSLLHEADDIKALLQRADMSSATDSKQRFSSISITQEPHNNQIIVKSFAHIPADRFILIYYSVIHCSSLLYRVSGHYDYTLTGSIPTPAPIYMFAVSRRTKLSIHKSLA